MITINRKKNSQHVSNSSPIILLSKINKLGLFKELYKEVFIARAVFIEVIEKGKREQYSDAFVAEKCVGDFIFVKEVAETEEFSKLKPALGKGEAESIMLSKQMDAELIIDDWKSRKIAESMGIECKSTLGVIFEALQKGKITLHEYETSIKELARSAWISGDVVAEFLQAAYNLRGDKK